MSQYTYKELVKLLKKHGAHLVRQGKGSHEVWQLNQNKTIVPKHKELKKRTYLEILKDLKIDKE